MAEKQVKQNKTLISALEMRHISKRFGATVALNEVSFSVLPGEVHALVGENGAGKSTLMKILSGAYLPDSGKMFLHAEPYAPQNPLSGRQSGVGMIYQELSLAPHLSVEENIVLGVEPAQFGFIDKKRMREMAIAALHIFNHPEIRPGMQVQELSIGARQLVEIARSLALGCRVLVFDEPTSSLPREDIERLFEIIQTLKKQEIAIVYISHFLEEVQQIADRITVLRDGKAVNTCTATATTPADIVRDMVGRNISELYPRSNRQAGEPVLVLHQLAGLKKPDDASLVLHRGEVFGICGLVGAGRTELVRAIFGLDPVKSGEIEVMSFVGSASPCKRWQQGAGMLSEDRKEEGLASNLSVAENMTLTKLRDLGPLNLIVPKQQNTAAQNWIELLNIRCQSPVQKIGALSGGNQQKAAFARLLHHDVDILLLDEPTRGIDVAAKAKIYALIDALAAGKDGKNGKKPKAILLVSSYLPELLGICDRIAVIARGRLGPAKHVDAWDEHELMLAATGK
ncbi:MAG: sugar ABC transporter ATP-binding protein [bacterium]